MDTFLIAVVDGLDCNSLRCVPGAGGESQNFGVARAVVIDLYLGTRINGDSYAVIRRGVQDNGVSIKRGFSFCHNGGAVGFSNNNIISINSNYQTVAYRSCFTVVRGQS